MPAKFVAMNVPDTGNDALNKALAAIVENVELLCGQRNPPALNAVQRGDITQTYPAADATLAELADTVRKLMRNLKEGA